MYEAWFSCSHTRSEPYTQFVVFHTSFNIGCGDFSLNDMSLLPDPCPLPDKEKKRSLDERERLIYAPMAGVGGMVYDKVMDCRDLSCDCHVIIRMLCTLS